MRKNIKSEVIHVFAFLGGMLLFTGCLDDDPQDPRNARRPAADTTPTDDAPSGGSLADDDPNGGSSTNIPPGSGAGAGNTPGGPSIDKCASTAEMLEDGVERCARTFVYRAPAGSEINRIQLAGSFECPEWSKSYTLASPNAAGEWAITLWLKPGTYDYKFVVDDEWVIDPENPITVASGDGGMNSQLSHVCPLGASVYIQR